MFVTRGVSGCQFSLAAIFFGLTWLAVVLSLLRVLGLHGPALVADVGLLYLVLVRNFRLQTWFPAPSISAIDVAVLTMICLVLHGLAMPAVTFSCHGRRAPAAIPVPGATPAPRVRLQLARRGADAADAVSAIAAPPLRAQR
jgi:hypothetical protein